MTKSKKFIFAFLSLCMIGLGQACRGDVKRGVVLSLVPYLLFSALGQLGGLSYFSGFVVYYVVAILFYGVSVLEPFWVSEYKFPLKKSALFGFGFLVVMGVINSCMDYHIRKNHYDFFMMNNRVKDVAVGDFLMVKKSGVELGNNQYILLANSQGEVKMYDTEKLFADINKDKIPEILETEHLRLYGVPLYVYFSTDYHKIGMKLN